MKKYRLIFCVIICAITSGCYYDVQEELHPGGLSSANCDTSGITFSGKVMQIFQSNCFGCHGPGITSGGVSLATYEGVSAVVEDGSLVGSIDWLPGFTKMPQNLPQLSECDRTTIKIWIENGSPNN